ncbi:MAG: hypothetical protein KTR31_41710 [Myxococcales bacterium]|nr:hypothetical protein [Myxococcales bacterium]
MRLVIITSTALVLAACAAPHEQADDMLLEPTLDSVAGMRGLVWATLQGGPAWTFDFEIQTDPGLTFVRWVPDSLGNNKRAPTATGHLQFTAESAGTWGFAVQTPSGAVRDGSITFTEAHALLADLDPWYPGQGLQTDPVHVMEGVAPELVVVDVAHHQLVASDARGSLPGEVRYDGDQIDDPLDLGPVVLPFPPIVIRQWQEISADWTVAVSQHDDGVLFQLYDEEGLPVVPSNSRQTTLVLFDAAYAPAPPDASCDMFIADLQGTAHTIPVCLGEACTETTLFGELRTDACNQPLREIPSCSFVGGVRLGWSSLLLAALAGRRRERD